MRTRILLVPLAALLSLSGPFASAADADLIVHHGKIVTVDKEFSIRAALAVRDGRIVRVGDNEEVLQLKGDNTNVLDLEGKTVIPGLIDSHVHPVGASLTEFDHPVPEMESIPDVLDYIKARAAVLEAGQWIEVQQVFITRLREQRYPTRDELDHAAPKNPVIFATGPDASLNSLALKLSEIDKNFQVKDDGPGHIERDPNTGDPTGILRSCTRFVKIGDRGRVRQPTADERDQRLLELLRDYNSVGLTAIVDRDADPSEIAQYRRLHDQGRLPLCVALSQHIDTQGPIDTIQENIRKVAADPLHGWMARPESAKGVDKSGEHERASPRPSPPQRVPPDARSSDSDDLMLRTIGIKTYLDGGMLTGSAYMRAPWGVSKIYAITDPAYRGLLFIPKDRLLPIVRTTVESGLQFTAHSVGDGAVHTLLEVYKEINQTLPVRSTRPCVTHSNFMSREAVELAAELGVIVDIQPAWLYLDTRTLLAQFGYDRLRYFQPLRSIFAAGGIAGGGSDHMQKIGSLRAINPYNPFLAMWVTITRRARWHEGQLHAEESLTREQALRFYTINNAYLMFLDHAIGSLEPGKLADFAVLDRDILTCPVDEIKDTQVLGTYVRGKPVFERPPPDQGQR
jgi:hypothetical protein